MPLSVAIAKMSSRFSPHEANAGELLKTPEINGVPRRVNGSQAPFLHASWPIEFTMPSWGPKMSRRFAAQEATAGAPSYKPFRFCQPAGVHAFPSHAMWYMAVCVPSAKTSRRFAAHEATAGGLLNVPPRVSQPDCGGHAPPDHAMCCTSLSSPSAKISTRLTPHEATAGGLLNGPPPRLSQPVAGAHLLSTH